MRRARSLSGRLVDGLHFRTGPGAGQQALLDAFAETDADLDADRPHDLDTDVDADHGDTEGAA